MTTAAPFLIDTHCHLDSAKFEGEVDAIVQRAVAAGVERLVTIGCARGLDNVDSALEVARTYPDTCRATVGVHPHDASALDSEVVERLEALATDPLVVAVGETGLDFYYDHSPRDVQREAFRRQVALARTARKPLIIHTRDAAEDTLTILDEEDARDVGGIIHCFSEDASFAKRALDLGFVSSFSGLVTFQKKAEAIRDAAAKQPGDALLVETDAPYLAPVPHRGQRNEPSFVTHTAREVARLRGVEEERLREETTANAFRLFGAW